MRSLLVLVLLTGPAIADPAPTRAPDVRAMHTDDCARARKLNRPCVLVMGNETVEGSVKSPDGIGVGVIEMPKEPSLIRLRRDFIEEILKTAEDL